MRAGTENVPGIVGMGKAAELAAVQMKNRWQRQTSLRDYMIHRIETEIPYCRLNGPRQNRLANNVNMSFSYVEGETIVIMLDMEGICTSSASACSAGQSESSHVLREIGLPEELAKGALRFTLNEETTREDIDYTVEKLKEAVEKSRKLNPRYASFLKLNEKR